MVVPEPGHFLAPGARITSRIGNTPVFIDVAEIATALDYQRPTRPVNFPRPDETFDQNEIAGYLYEHRKNARIPHWPGRFTTAYRFINQVVCFNLYPRGQEGAPQRSVGNLMYAFMGEDTVSDWALYIFGQMCDFRDALTTLRMPFPCLVTKILRTRNVPGKRFYSNEDLLPGDLDSSFIQRSMAHPTSSTPSPSPPSPPQPHLHSHSPTSTVMHPPPLRCVVDLHIPISLPAAPAERTTAIVAIVEIELTEGDLDLLSSVTPSRRISTWICLTVKPSSDDELKSTEKRLNG
ncbi:hypothetical protein RHGRI_022077 [Rhododendron griersonianum]|uniref:Uncharacterized protein n=1 Tax=Rhododendron griersonianum TaxID=479676 RepID=A0AAV6JMH4_9ERIC|nr:hypothetical protein RHGRI_022077 [Rhododendron griersonianum]